MITAGPPLVQIWLDLRDADVHMSRKRAARLMRRNVRPSAVRREMKS